MFTRGKAHVARGLEFVIAGHEGARAQDKNTGCIGTGHRITSPRRAVSCNVDDQLVFFCVISSITCLEAGKWPATTTYIAVWLVNT